MRSLSVSRKCDCRSQPNAAKWRAARRQVGGHEQGRVARVEHHAAHGHAGVAQARQTLVAAQGLQGGDKGADEREGSDGNSPLVDAVDSRQADGAQRPQSQNRQEGQDAVQQCRFGKVK